MKSKLQQIPGLLGDVALFVTAGLLAFAGGAGLAADEDSSQVHRVPVEVSAGDSSWPPKADELEVWLQYEPQEILAVHIGPARPAWQVLVYVDAPLADPQGLQEAMRILAHQTGSLVALGPTEIVLADPVPRLYLEPTIDKTELREAVKDVATDAMTAGELEWLRQRFLDRPDESELTGEASQALRNEVELVERQRRSLLQTLAQRTGSGPRLLVLVQNGFDLNPRGFYSEQTGSSFLEDPRTGLSHQVSARAIAAEGWTVLAVATGRRSKIISEPLAPLYSLVDAAGGRVATGPKEVTQQLERMQTWPILEVSLQDDGSDEPQPFAILDQASQLPHPSSRWASATGSPTAVLTLDDPDVVARESSSSRPVIALLRPGAAAVSGEVRLRTISGRRRIDRVQFLLDGKEVEMDTRSPFATTVDLGDEARPCEVTAIAYSKSGRPLGQDSLQLNMDLEPERVTITELVVDQDSDQIEVSAEANAPSGHLPDRVEFFLGAQLQADLTAPPYRVLIPYAEPKPQDFVRVLAHYPNGKTAQAALMTMSELPTDEVDVNMIELLAIVSPKNRGTLPDLHREDFRILQSGRPMPIDSFARWEEVPLTIGVVVDTSSSMDSVMDDARQAGEQFLNQVLRAGDEAFVVDFDNLPRLARHSTEQTDELLRSLVGMQARGATALYDAIVFSLLQFDNTSGRRALVVVTDGEDSASRYSPSECIRQAEFLGVPIYLILLGTPSDPGDEPHFMRNHMIARRTGGQYYYVNGQEDMARIYDRISTELRRQYFLSFTADRSLSPEELEQIEVEVRHKGISVKALLASQQAGG